MEFNRNQFFFLGMFILLIGIQVRVVETYVLSPEASKILAERAGGKSLASASDTPGALAAGSSGSFSRKSFQPPEWLGWCLMSIGAVLILHSLAMPRPS